MIVVTYIRMGCMYYESKKRSYLAYFSYKFGIEMPVKLKQLK